MISKKAACDPCRTSKLGCDHEQPICARCRKSRKPDACIYREKPFKRLKRAEASSPSGRDSIEKTLDDGRGDDALLQSTSNIDAQANATIGKTSWEQAAPDPGYLGPSSHSGILDQVPLHDRAPIVNIDHPETSPDVEACLKHTAWTLEKLLLNQEPNALQAIVSFWRDQGHTLQVGEGVTDACVDSVKVLIHIKSTAANTWSHDFINLLYKNSNTELAIQSTDTMSSFTSQFSAGRPRLESFGIFLNILALAVLYTPCFPPLYTSQAQRISLRDIALKLSDLCWDLCLSLNSLNILQLIFQYENFILHSPIDGPQSLQHWRRMGAVISSVVALGYHEAPGTRIAQFSLEIRQALFARIYSADKHTALFLGRPPRLSKRFCTFQLPSREYGTFSSWMPGGAGDLWLPNARLDQTAMTCWYALSGALQEEIMELLRLKQGESLDWYQAAVALRSRAEGQWAALPSHFKLVGSLHDARDRTQMERWHLLSIRFAYLHQLFLLNLLMLVNVNKPDSAMLTLCHEILAKVVEAIIGRNELTGVGLAWKVAHYGLSAAGMAILAILQPHQHLSNERLEQQRSIIQYLIVLVAEVNHGGLISVDGPSAGLFRKATRTIQSFLDSVKFTVDTSAKISDQPQDTDVLLPDDAFALFGTDSLELDIDWWQTLGEHPLLSNEELML